MPNSNRKPTLLITWFSWTKSILSCSSRCTLNLVKLRQWAASNYVWSILNSWYPFTKTMWKWNSNFSKKSQGFNLFEKKGNSKTRLTSFPLRENSSNDIFVGFCYSKILDEFNIDLIFLTWINNILKKNIWTNNKFSKGEPREYSTIANFELKGRLIEKFEFVFLFLVDLNFNIFFLFISTLILFDFECLSHFESLIFILLEQLTNFFYLRVLRIESIQIIIKLLCLSFQTLNADNDIFASNHAVIVIGVPTFKNSCFFSFNNSKSTQLANGTCAETLQFWCVIFH